MIAVTLEFERENTGREIMSSKKGWEPFSSVFCPEIKKSVSGEIQVLIHVDTARKESQPVPTGKMECSGESECRIVDKKSGCPVFNSFCAFLKT